MLNLDHMETKKAGIYIHIPFCERKCRYCDFNSVDNAFDKQTDYLQALIKDIRLRKDLLKDYSVDTVFIGGGTPSFLFKGAIATILSEVKKNYQVLKDAEITLECNPNSVTREKAFEWKSAGVNRVSVGLQSSGSKILKIIGRTHNKSHYIKAMQTLKSVGFNNINTDLMIGLPSQKQSDIKQAINLAESLGSTHISCYSLIVEENTPLKKMVERGEVKLPKEEKVTDAYFFAVNYLKKLEFFQYEVSNFSRVGYQCKHNLHCWNLQEYLGFGSGAHSYLNGERFNNEKNLFRYIDKVKNGLDTTENLENVEEDWLDEYIMLALRTVRGMDIGRVDRKLNINFLQSRKNAIEKLKKEQLIEVKDNFLYATAEGFYVLNYIISHLL